MAKKQGLYSDLDEFIEEGGRHNVEKDVKQEGNIPSGKPKKGGSPSQPISSSDSRPESPQREGNIQPAEGTSDESPQRRKNIQRRESATPEKSRSRGNIDSRENTTPESPQRKSIDPKENFPQEPENQSIPTSDQAPEEPQRRGNIQPRQFNPKKGQIERDAKKGAEPETPRRKQNIRPDESNRPENPNRVSRQPREEAAPSKPNQRSRNPKSEARPQEPNQSSRQARDEATPDSPNRNRRKARSGATPSSSNQNQRAPKENAAPQEPSQDQRKAKEDSQPQNPQRRVINLREAAAPSGPSRRGNIQPSEEPPTTEPAEGTDIDVNAENRPPQNDQVGNINSKDRRPDSPQRGNNIGATENAAPQRANQTNNIPSREGASPQEPNRSEIQAEENKPESSQRGGNISPKDENQPSGPSQSGNINPNEDSKPEAPSRENNISPKEESRPSQADSDGAISPTEESGPKSPSRQENINPTEESEPESPNRSENISPTEDSEPEVPSRNQNISPPEESQPPSSQAQGNISPREEPQPKAPNRSENIQPTEESEPEAPSDSGNIAPPEEPQPPSVQSENNISPTEESEPESPTRQENISPAEDSRPSSPQGEENISPTEESEPESPNRLENINPPEEPQPEEPNRKSAIDPTENSEPSEPSRQDNISPTEESEPEGPNKRGNINPPEEPQPPEPDSSGAISPTEESEPSGPQRESNIPPTEESEPESPNQDGFISPTEESEPGEPDQDGFISPTEEPQPQEPQKEGNIDPSDEEVTDGTGDQPLSEPQRQGNIDPKDSETTDGIAGEQISEPQREGNIDPTDKNVTDGTGDEPLSEPRREGNIDPTNAEKTDGVGGEEPSEPQKKGNIDPTDSENTDGIGGEEIDREQPLKFQPARFSSQIDPENVDFVDSVAGSEDAAPEWQPPLRYQPEIYAGQIDPSDEGGRYQLERFVAGSNEPGDNVRNMAYDNEGVDEALRFQNVVNEALDNGTIDPNFEGGIYSLPSFVAGSNEPGDNVRDMAYDQDGASEGLRHQPQNVQQKLRGGTIINPGDEGGRYQLEQFVAGSDEPGGDIRDMGYDVEGANENLRHQPENIRQKLRSNTIINPEDEGGRYQLEDFVAGANEPGENVLEMPSSEPYDWPMAFQSDRFKGQIDPKSGSEFREDFGDTFPGEDNPAPEWEAPLRHHTDRFADQIDPADEGGKYQLETFVAGSDEPGDQLREMPSSQPYQWPMVHQSDRFRGQIDPETSEFTDGVGGNFPSSENAAPEWEEPKESQTRFEGEINPRNPDTTDGVGGSFPSSENATIEANETEEFQTRFQGEIEDLNRTIRLSQFDNLFGDGRTDLPVADTPIPRAEFTQASIGPDQPFILRRPEAGGGSAVIANAKQADSRTAPVASAAEDTVRISKFFATGKGITYNIKQQFLQSQNPRTRTRIYDPTSPIQTSASGMAVRPGQQITRHVSADSGPLGLVGDAASAIGDIAGFDVPQSSRYEDELKEEAVETEWGEMQGSLFWLSPVAQRALPEVTGEGARSRINQIRSGNVQNIKPLFSTSEQDQLSQFAASALGRQGGIGNGYLFTNSYDPQGGPGGEGREETDNYHPSVPYVRNVDSMNSRREPTGSAYVAPEFSSPGEQLRALTTAARNAKDSVFPFINPNATPSTDNITDGRGGVIAQRQNDTTSEVYYENRVIARGGDRIPVHRGVQQKENHALPNYSKKNEGGEKINRIDWINRLEPIVGKGADPEQETFGEGQHKDFIPFKFYDIENEGLIVFRAFLEGISDNLSPDWSQQEYTGRPEQGHIYGGYTNTISFSFQVAPFSKEEFEAQWKKINYLKGLTTPSGYNVPAGGGGYMTPPFMRMTIGDMFNDVYGYMNSLTISVNDDMDWEIDEDVGRLPRGIEVDVDWQVIEKRAPLALQKFYDAPFIDAIEEPTRESPNPREEVLPKSADDPAEKPGIDTNRAIDQATESGGSSEGENVNPENTTPFVNIPNFTP